MAGWMDLFRCIAQAVRERGMRALMGIIPFGEGLYDLAVAARDHLLKCDHPEPRKWVEQAAQADPNTVRAVARQVADEVAADQPPEVRIKLASYLEQVPGPSDNRCVARPIPRG